MTNDATRATAEALPEINRRRMLLGLAAAGTTMTAVAVATTEAKSAVTDEIEENPDLVAAWKEFRAAETEYYASKEALDWLADEWKHLWPLAPEEILGAANAHTRGAYSHGIERNIIGNLIMRDTSVLTKRLDKEFRQKCRETAFFIDQPDKLSEHLEEVRGRKPKGKTPKTREKRRRANERHVAELEMRLRLAKEYHAETQRIRALAGVNAAKQRITTAESQFDIAATAVSKIGHKTRVGLRLKADVLLSCLERWKLPRNDAFIFGATWRLVEDTLDATQDLDGKRSSVPLPAFCGGAV